MFILATSYKKVQRWSLLDFKYRVTFLNMIVQKFHASMHAYKLKEQYGIAMQKALRVWMPCSYFTKFHIAVNITCFKILFFYQLSDNNFLKSKVGRSLHITESIHGAGFMAWYSGIAVFCRRERWKEAHENGIWRWILVVIYSDHILL